MVSAECSFEILNILRFTSLFLIQLISFKRKRENCLEALLTTAFSCHRKIWKMETYGGIYDHFAVCQDPFSVFNGFCPHQSLKY